MIAEKSPMFEEIKEQEEPGRTSSHRTEWPCSLYLGTYPNESNDKNAQV